MPSPPVSVASRRTVRPPPRPSERIPLTAWDLALLPADYLQYGLLFAPLPVSTAHLIDHLEAALADALAVYYPVAGRLATEQHRDDKGQLVEGCSVSIDCAGQGVEILHAVADGVAIANVVPPDADVPAVVRSFFPLDGAVNHEGHELPSSSSRSPSSPTASSSASRTTTRSPTVRPSGTSSTHGLTLYVSGSRLWKPPTR
jgi:hypothetical protein